MSVSIITCVTNFGSGMGAGHSCLAVSGTVFTFENILGFIPGGASGWNSFSLPKYLEMNRDRPVFIQKLYGIVKPGMVLDYISTSISRDDLYGFSGVCSSQTANAIQYAWGKNFDPSGIDSPYAVYLLAKGKRLVEEETFHWPGKENLPIGKFINIHFKLSEIEKTPIPRTELEEQNFSN